MAIKQPNISPFDSDAQRFILAAGISNKTQKRAINYLVQGLKANGLWAKMVAVYPFVGGTAYSCKFNLINPRDSVLAFELTFVASPTITDIGVDWNGTTQYANTNLNLAATSTVYTLNDAHISYYSREDTANTGVLIGGALNSGTVRYAIFNKTQYGLNVVAPDSFTVTNTKCFITVSRTASNLTTLYRNGASVATSAQVTTTIPGSNIYIGCRSVNDAPSSFTDKQCAFASIGSGLSSVQAFIYYNIIQQFQIILNRAV